MFHPHRCIKRLLVCLFVLGGCIGARPQRDIRGLHRLPYHPHQITAQRELLCEAEVRTREPLLKTISRALSAVSARDAWGYFEHSGATMRPTEGPSMCSFCLPDGPLHAPVVN
jgi:hypothetical protein